ncbi:hypothetical protein [Altericista sp. CCNU0014]|uniref:hypothetical protein n=1 Tax=Altericista sp. CCNU0014 TaxID=3082949 RepID=UPI0038503986
MAFQRYRGWIAAGLAAIGLSQSTATFAQTPINAGATPNRFEIALIGDAPYSALEERQYPNVVADINRSKSAFVIHDGDIQSSASPCTDELTLSRRSLYQTFRIPFVLVPGDNEWTDCHRTGGDPLARLAKLRELFFATDYSLGQTVLKLERQSQSPKSATYRENVRWGYGSVLFVGLHLVGSNNNFGRTPEMDREFKARDRANLDWLKSSFALARQQQRSGIMLVMQANPGFELPREQRTGFNDFLDALLPEAIAFAKPVALVHGDSHYFRIDKPLVGPRNQRVMNFTRVETFGPPDMHWVRATIDPTDPNLFEFEPVTVKANIMSASGNR